MIWILNASLSNPLILFMLCSDAKVTLVIRSREKKNKKNNQKTKQKQKQHIVNYRHRSVLALCLAR